MTYSTAIVDYGAGNVTSVRNAFATIGADAVVTRDAAVVAVAERIVFPGVGAAQSAMANLREMGLVDAVRAAAVSGRPFLGICLGMQILFERSEEDGGVETLGVIAGRVRRFPSVPGFKVPEIGWNAVVHKSPEECARCGQEPVAGLAAGGRAAEFYFVHSYYAETVPETIGTSEYAGVEFTAMVRRGRLWACQFHPEKSGRIGLNLLKEWMSC